MANEKVRHKELLEQLQGLVSPKIFSQVSSQLDPGGSVASDNQNQNQNQGREEEFAKLKPDILREITIGSSLEDELSANQNQNQGKLAELLKLKPDVLRQMRISLRGGAEVMDNQNQNQGRTAEQLKPTPANAKSN